MQNIRAMELKPQAIKTINEMTEIISKLYLSSITAKRHILEELVLDFIEDD